LTQQTAEVATNNDAGRSGISVSSAWHAWTAPVSLPVATGESAAVARGTVGQIRLSSARRDLFGHAEPDQVSLRRRPVRHRCGRRVWAGPGERWTTSVLRLSSRLICSTGFGDWIFFRCRSGKTTQAVSGGTVLRACRRRCRPGPGPAVQRVLFGAVARLIRDVTMFRGNIPSNCQWQ